MKKGLAVVVAVVLTTMLLAVAGCGDTSKAQEYMKNGDELSINLEGYSQKVGDDIGEFLAELGVDLAVTGAIEFKTMTDTAKKQINNLIAGIEEAIIEYNKILGLDGVDEYKRYAELRVKAIDNTVSVLGGIKEDLLDRLGAALEEGKSLSDELATWTKENTKMIADLVKAVGYWAEAARYKSAKNL